MQLDLGSLNRMAAVGRAVNGPRRTAGSRLRLVVRAIRSVLSPQCYGKETRHRIAVECMFYAMGLGRARAGAPASPARARIS